jgi:hypothetical protein
MLILRLINNRFGASVVLAVALCASIAVAGGAGQAAVATAPQPVATVPPEVREHFALFRTQRATPLPLEVAEAAGSPLFFGRNANLARRISTVSGTGWVIPGHDHLCVVVPDPVEGYGTVCSANSWVKDHGLVIGLTGASYGGNTAVTVVAPDSGVVTLGDSQSSRPIASDHGVVSRVVATDQALAVRPR